MIKRPLRAILLDVDGTLYHQGPLRCFMGLELCTLLVSKQSGQAAYRLWRALDYFRRIREELRLLGAPAAALATLQYVEAAQRTGEEQAYIEAVVAEWMHQRPLKYLRLCRRRGLKAFLTFLKSQGFQVGVFSDYPALDKLQALGLAGTMSLTLCATDPEINAFKPHPKGFLHACALWGSPRKRCCTSGIAQRWMPVSRPMQVCHALFLEGGNASGDTVFLPLQGYNMRSLQTLSRTPSLWPYIQIARVDHWFMNWKLKAKIQNAVSLLPSSFSFWALTLALTCCRKPKRGTSVGCRQSGAARG